jgi:hypothetical protein
MSHRLDYIMKDDVIQKRKNGTGSILLPPSFL